MKQFRKFLILPFICVTVYIQYTNGHPLPLDNENHNSNHGIIKLEKLIKRIFEEYNFEKRTNGLDKHEFKELLSNMKIKQVITGKIKSYLRKQLIDDDKTFDELHKRLLRNLQRMVGHNRNDKDEINAIQHAIFELYDNDKKNFEIETREFTQFVKDLSLYNDLLDAAIKLKKKS